jgi:hypothetical protein
MSWLVLQKTVLTSYVGRLNEAKLRQLDKALASVLALDL